MSPKCYSLFATLFLVASLSRIGLASAGGHETKYDNDASSSAPAPSPTKESEEATIRVLDRPMEFTYYDEIRRSLCKKLTRKDGTAALACSKILHRVSFSCGAERKPSAMGSSGRIGHPSMTETLKACCTLCLQIPNGKCELNLHKKSEIDWESIGINVADHTFGSVPQKQFIDGEIADVRQALVYSILAQVNSKSCHKCMMFLLKDETNKHLMHYRELHHEPLGKSKPLIPGIQVDKNMIYGMKTTWETDGGVKSIFQQLDQSEDTQFSANWKSEDHHEISFKPPSKETSADELIRPSSFSGHGLDSGEHCKIRDKEEIFKLMTKAQINIDTSDFNKIFEVASRVNGSDGTKCSISSFMQTRMQMLHNTPSH
eukprot:g425.t1